MSAAQKGHRRRLLRAAMVQIEADTIRSETEFVARYRHLNNDELQRVADDVQRLSFRLRHMLYKRFEQTHDVN